MKLFRFSDQLENKPEIQFSEVFKAETFTKVFLTETTYSYKFQSKWSAPNMKLMLKGPFKVLSNNCFTDLRLCYNL